MLDQSIKADADKTRPTLVPTEIIRAIAKVRAFGVRKYGDNDSWKRVERERYRDAMCRHLLAYLDDPESIDDESGYPHLWHLACNVAFLIELEKNGNIEEYMGESTNMLCPGCLHYEHRHDGGYWPCCECVCCLNGSDNYWVGYKNGT